MNDAHIIGKSLNHQFSVIYLSPMKNQLMKLLIYELMGKGIIYDKLMKVGQTITAQHYS